MSNRAGRDEAVNPGPDREAGPPRSPIQPDGLIEHCARERGFDDGKRMHRVTRELVGPFVAETLQDFLDDGKTGDYILEVHKPVQSNGRRLSKDVNPDRRVNENHDAVSDRRRGPREPRTGPLPTGPSLRAAECASPWRDGRSPRAPARPFGSTCARRSSGSPPPAAHRSTQDLCVSCVSSVARQDFVVKPDLPVAQTVGVVLRRVKLR